MKLNWNFLGGRRSAKPKTFCGGGGGVWIFCGTAHYVLSSLLLAQKQVGSQLAFYSIMQYWEWYGK